MKCGSEQLKNKILMMHNLIRLLANFDWPFLVPLKTLLISLTHLFA